MNWADQFRRLKVRTNADTPEDAANAVRMGAEGIGLTRTEHMFFNPERIPKIRKMILSDTVEEREAALNELIPFQKGQGHLQGYGRQTGYYSFPGSAAS